MRTAHFELVVRAAQHDAAAVDAGRELDRVEADRRTGARGARAFGGNGVERVEVATGTGPVDASYKAIEKLVDQSISEPTMEHY